MFRRLRFRAFPIAMVVGLAAAVSTMAVSPAPAYAVDSCASSTTALVNPGFEEPVKPLNTSSLLPQADVPGWETTDPTGIIELWGSGFLGVPAYQDRQFAELNSFNASTLYQDVATVPGERLYWSLAHRARNLSGSSDPVTDVMRVMIGGPGGTLTQSGPDLSDTDLAWGVHTGTYVVPNGQTTTRFAFEAVSSGGGAAGAGNFLDAISFTSASCVTATLAVSDAVADAGDELTYTATVSNDGGATTTSLDVSIPIPAGTTYVPGSASTGGVANGSAVEFVQPSGIGGPGVLGIGESITVSFRVAIDDPTAAMTLVNSASVTVRPMTPDSFETNEVTTEVLPTTFTVDYDAGPGIAERASDVYLFGQDPITLPSATRAGYSLIGWFTEPSGGDQVESPFTPTEPQTLYARWSPNVNTVVYDSDGGSAVADGTFITGETFTVAPAPTRDGYTFEGWYDESGTLRTGTYTPTETSGFTLFARWTPVPSALPATGLAVGWLAPVGMIALISGAALVALRARSSH